MPPTRGFNIVRRLTPRTHACSSCTCTAVATNRPPNKPQNQRDCPPARPPARPSSEGDDRGTDRHSVRQRALRVRHLLPAAVPLRAPQGQPHDDGSWQGPVQPQPIRVRQRELSAVYCLLSVMSVCLFPFLFLFLARARGWVGAYALKSCTNRARHGRLYSQHLKPNPVVSRRYTHLYPYIRTACIVHAAHLLSLFLPLHTRRTPSSVWSPHPPQTQTRPA